MGDLGKKLKELREERRLTQREVARALKISNTRLSDYEAGATHSTGRKAVPKREVLERAAEFFGYPLDILLALAGYPQEHPDPRPIPPIEESEIKEIAEIYHRLSRSRRDLLMGVVRAFRFQAVDLDKSSSEAEFE